MTHACTLFHLSSSLFPQRKAVPTAVIAQCVREEKAEERTKQLGELGYFGDDPCTGVQQLMEGELFKIQVGLRCCINRLCSVNFKIVNLVLPIDILFLKCFFELYTYFQSFKVESLSEQHHIQT